MSLKFVPFQLRKNIALLFVGEKSRLTEQAITNLLPSLKQDCKDRIQYASKNFTKGCSTTFIDEGHIRLTLAYLKSETSRNMGLFRADTIGEVLKAAVDEDSCQVVFVLKNSTEIPSATSAIARTFPRYNTKTDDKSRATKERQLFVSFALPDNEQCVPSKYEEMQSLASNVALAAELTDTPPTDLDPVEYARRVEQLTRSIEHVTTETIVGDDLRERGLNTIWSVGKAAVNPAHLIILHYQPPNGDSLKSIAFVGKGITYDTGGLAIKSREGMCGMKMDMGGSAAVLGAFLHLVETKHPHPVVAALCIAENAVSAKSLKNDDIIHAYSGKTIEVNNTDAEGRLVLADGVSYVTKHYRPSVLIDIATLTGAQSVCTGKHHAGILSPTVELENRILQAARTSGDLAFPMLYCPELLLREFKSEVADMKNAATTRTNAPSSCAGHFIEQHLDVEWVKNPETAWAHLDIAGPSHAGDRATGFGVSLLSAFAKDHVL